MNRFNKSALALVAGVSVLSGCSLLGAGDAPRDESGEINKQVSADAFSIRVGDCLDDPGEGDIDRVPVVPCSEPHELEVFHEFSLQVPDYPSTPEAMEELTYDRCDPAFQAFVGRAYKDSRLDYTSMNPTESSWAEGDRSVHCLIADPDSVKVTGTLAGINE